MRNFESIGLILVGAVSFSILLFVLTAGIVEAHFLGYDSVDDCEIRWKENTKYDIQRVAATEAWEDLKGDDNCVDLEPDTWNTYADLEWKDVNYYFELWAGLYQNEAGTDDILLNIHFMDQYDGCTRKSVAMHELGHAHGLNESFAPNVMTESPTEFPCTLGPHDISDYEELWGE